MLKLVEESGCGTCKEIFDKVSKAAVENISTLVTETITDDDKKHIPATTALKIYMAKVMEILGDSVVIEQQKAAESGASMAEVHSMVEDTMDSVFNMMEASFSVDISAHETDGQVH